MGGKYILQTISSLVAFGAHIAIAIALIVVALSVVGRHRPDASGPFLFAGIVDLVGTLLHWLLVMVGPRVISDYEGLPTFFAATSLLGVCFNIGWGALLLVGIARVARPAPGVAMPPMPPFR